MTANHGAKILLGGPGPLAPHWLRPWSNWLLVFILEIYLKLRQNRRVWVTWSRGPFFWKISKVIITLSGITLHTRTLYSYLMNNSFNSYKRKIQCTRMFLQCLPYVYEFNLAYNAFIKVNRIKMIWKFR